jgi:hypothetical protein
MEFSIEDDGSLYVRAFALAQKIDATRPAAATAKITQNTIRPAFRRGGMDESATIAIPDRRDPPGVTLPLGQGCWELTETTSPVM